MSTRTEWKAPCKTSQLFLSTTQSVADTIDAPGDLFGTPRKALVPFQLSNGLQFRSLRR